MALRLPDLPATALIIIGIVVLLGCVVAYENWRLMRLRQRSGYHGAGLGDAYPRYRPWQELSPWMRALRVSVFICWIVTIGSISTVGYIEAAALRQPKIADAEFVYPHNVKGVVRLFTDQQEGIYAIAKPLMIGFGAITLALIVVGRRVEEDWRERKLQEALDRLSTEV